VKGELRLGQAQRFGELADAALAIAERFDQLQSQEIGECLEQGPGG
jgi:hypothetical protein